MQFRMSIAEQQGVGAGDSSPDRRVDNLEHEELPIWQCYIEGLGLSDKTTYTPQSTA